jgi:hypothetical protein
MTSRLIAVEANLPRQAKAALGATGRNYNPECGSCQ